MLGLIQSTASPTFTLSKGLLTITGTYDPFPVIPLTDIISLAKIAKVDETANVRTVTITRVASTSYGLMITQTVPAGTGDYGTSVINVPFKYTSSAGAASTQEIVDAFVALINANTRLKVVAAATADTTFTVTTDAGYPLMNIAEAPPSVNISIANTTPGVRAVGLGADLITASVPGAETGKTYKTYAGRVRKNKNGNVVEEDLTLYIENALTVTDLDNILTASGVATASVPYVAKN